MGEPNLDGDELAVGQPSGELEGVLGGQTRKVDREGYHSVEMRGKVSQTLFMERVHLKELGGDEKTDDGAGS